MIRVSVESESKPERSHPVVRAIVWILIWIGVAFLFASQQVASRPFLDGQSVSWSKALQLPLLIAAWWSLLAIVVPRVIKRYPLERRSWLFAFCVHLTFATVLSCLFVAICGTVMYLVASNSTYSTSSREWELTWWNIFFAFSRITFHSNMLIYFAILAVGQTIDFNRKLRAREKQNSRLQLDLISARFDQLRAQLQPHFLFNTLSAITTFVDRDPQAAKEMIVRLSDLLRVVVDQPSTRTRRLEDELEFLRKYVEIQTARFGDRFVFDEEVEDQALDVQIPFLLFQPLVENAIKHGVCETSGVCCVKLSVKIIGDRVEIIISDTGPGSDPGTLVEGVGLQNTRSRIRQLYGEEHEFRVDSGESGFTVHVALPARYGSVSE